MKELIILAVVLIIVCAIFGCLPSKVEREKIAMINNITVTELKEKISRGEDFTLLDVREQYEYDAGHIENTKHIPLGQLKDRVGELDKEKELVIYCQGGVRSLKAAKLFIELGFSKVTNVKGGYARW